MSWVFDSIIDAERGIKPFVWYIRWAMIENETGEKRSDFIKFVGTAESTKQDAKDYCAPIITKQLFALNNPPAPFQIIPEACPILPGLTGAQQTALNNIWPQLRDSLRARNPANG